MPTVGPATYPAEKVAELAGVSAWALYNTVKDGTCPFPFLKIGRRIVFPKAAVDRLLALEEDG